jgi:uncharacterized membrane protein YtjA (UPF0391 family)
LPDSTGKSGARGTYSKGSKKQQRSDILRGVRKFQAEANMLYWALVFLLIAVVAGVLGLTGVAILSAGIAKLLFFVFLVLFLITLVSHLGRRGTA